jgi:hypothetical protein
MERSGWQSVPWPIRFAAWLVAAWVLLWTILAAISSPAFAFYGLVAVAIGAALWRAPRYFRAKRAGRSGTDLGR